MNLFFKQAARKPLFTILLVLLLAFSVALSCIGYAAWKNAQIQKEAVFSDYTTIAIPKQATFNPSSKMTNAQRQAANEEFIRALQNGVFADHAAQEAPQLRMIDRRCLLSAHIAGLKSLSSSRVDPNEYHYAFDQQCYSLAVFALRCNSVQKNSYGYSADFTVEDIVCLSDAYDSLPKPDSLIIEDYRGDVTGETPFEAGKTYLVFGQYQDYPPDYNEVLNPNLHRSLIPFPQIYRSESDTEEKQLPWYCEYTGSVEEYLSSDAASVWREEILPLCRLNQDSATVILTDSIESMYSFNTGAASLLSGRFFTQEEYAQGANVCIVSAAYAELNGLKLGSTIPMEFYNSSFVVSTNGATVYSSFSTEKDAGPFFYRNYMTPGDAIGVSKEYTVVGIYTSARFAFGTYHFNADTILVPKASVPDAQNYEEATNSLLNSFILKNGSSEEFEAYMEQQGLGGQFLYFDQDFSSMQESLAALETNAARLLTVGVGGFLLACALFLFLNFRRMKPAIRGVRLMGRSSKAVFGELIAILLPLELLAIVLGAGAAVVLFDTVTAKILSSTLMLQYETIAVASAVEFVLFAAATGIGSAVLANRKLMKSK